ncbi:type II secretion system protein N [Candidatus Photodesmus anomalopis]|uniref:type II secretion system protein N n=1 Tax=Candidatus Photodesmus anomalopis TaxID=28176 RepID=UPI0009DBF77C|nr:type II secretion system protein N [Candidatus Photodesmus katoptron]
MKKSNLFGVYKNQNTPKQEDSMFSNTKEKYPTLKLVGVITSSIPDKNLAVISNKGSQTTYGINEKIKETQATIKVILLDQVIIDNIGYKEILTINKNQVHQKLKKNNVINNDNFYRIRDLILQDNKKFFQYIRIFPVNRNGNIIGYRMIPGEKKVY